jgi:hypothetical protein
MVFKITGIVTAATNTDFGKVNISFVGGVRGGPNHKEKCTLVMQSSPISKQHIIKKSVNLAGKAGNGYAIFWDNDHLNITQASMMDIVPLLTSKRKGGGKETVDEKITRTISALKGRDTFISINPKGNFLSDETMKGTYIEIVFH